MKTLRLVGVAFLTVLLNFCLSGCGKSGDDNNSESKKRNFTFDLDGQKFKVGDTIHVVDGFTEYHLTWEDTNGFSADVDDDYISDYNFNIINLDKQYNNTIYFYVNDLGVSKMVLYDFKTDQEYFFYIAVDPIDLKEHFEITGPHIDYLIDEKVVDGPFIVLKLSEKINDFRRMGYVDIISFGSDTGMKAANADNGYWPSVWDTEKGEQGRTYVGKIGNQTATYWAFKIDYRGQSHEIRRYGDSKVFLWDGEWNN